MTNIQFISKHVATAAINIQNTVQLLQEECTIPFISRYRKDKTGRSKTLRHTRWIRGRGDLRRGKWIGDERFETPN